MGIWLFRALSVARGFMERCGVHIAIYGTGGHEGANTSLSTTGGEPHNRRRGESVERIRVRHQTGELQRHRGNAAAERRGVAYRGCNVYSASVETYCRGGEVVGFTCPHCGIWVFPYAWHICWEEVK